jgi:signal transduction histidine kinase
LNLSDDGIGFDLNQVRDKNGIGLKNIQSRVEQLNGSIQMNSKKDMGTHFIIKLINE